MSKTGRVNQPTIISDVDAIAALQRSGYLLETRVESLLRGRGWVVEMNSAYPDPTTGKSRELDVYAVSGSKIAALNARPSSYVFQRLLIECEHPPQPIVFVTTESLLDERKLEYLKEVSDPPFVWGKDGYLYDLAHSLRLDTFHHYASGRVATQYCSFTQKKDKSGWMALHEDDQHMSFEALGQALEFHLEELREQQRWILSRKDENRGIHVELVYPVLIVDGGLRELDQSRSKLRLKAIDRICYRRQVMVEGEVRVYMITVVTEKGLPDLVILFEKECDRIASAIGRKRALFMEAQTRLANLNEEELAKLPVVVSPHLERIVAAQIEYRKKK